MTITFRGLLGAGVGESPDPPLPPSGDILIGYVSDLHYNATKTTALNRYYTDGLDKLGDAVTAFNAAAIDLGILLGDMIDHEGTFDASDAQTDLAGVKTVWDGLDAPGFYGWGNHDHDQLTKAELRAALGLTDDYYYVDAGDYRIVVLDPNYRSDSDSDPYSAGNYTWTTAYVPPAQRTWLADTALDTERPVIVFCHQRLVGASSYIVNNALAVRGILETAGNVKAVISGHRHRNTRHLVNGINYIGMMAATEYADPTNAYGTISVSNGGDTIEITGFDRQTSYDPVPLALANVTLWMKADVWDVDDGSAATHTTETDIGDISGISNHPTGGNPPPLKRNIVNGRPVWRANGTSHDYDLPDGTIPTGSGEYTIFAVINHTFASGESGDIISAGNIPSANQKVLFKIHTDARLNTGWHSNNLFSSNNAAPASTWLVVTTCFDGSGRFQRVNGADAGSDSQTAKNTSSGSNALMSEVTGGFYKGDLAEVIVIADGLDTTSIEAVEAYLAEQYGITLV